MCGLRGRGECVRESVCVGGCGGVQGGEQFESHKQVNEIELLHTHTHTKNDNSSRVQAINKWPIFIES